MAAHVQELVEAVDQPLRRSAVEISKLAHDSITPESVQPLLAASSLASDSRFWLLFIDAQGKGVVASNGLAVRGVAFADRPYFYELAANPDARLHVGAPVVGRVSKRRVFFLSRQVMSSSGKFIGVVAAPVDAERIADVFDRSRLGSEMSIGLSMSDNVVIARAPLFEESFAADLSGLPLAIGSSSRSGSLEAASPFRGERVLYSYAQVGSLPLRVIVGVTKESSMRHFRSDVLAGLIALAVALTVALFSGRFALEQFQRMEAVEKWQRKLIIELSMAKDGLARGERRLRMIADNVPARVAYINVDERYTFHNEGELGAPLGAAMGKTLLQTHGPEVYAIIQESAARALAGDRVDIELSYAVDGRLRHFKHHYTPDLAPDGRVAGFYAMVTDITEFKEVQARLAAIARVDALTGLPNRAELLDRLERALARCRRTGGSLACLYLDIDRFKEVNDTHGHAGGDCALIEFSRRLRQCVRESDFVARIAGDEFVIVLEGIGALGEAKRVGDQIIGCMATPFDIEGTPRLVTTSVGMVVAYPQRDDALSLLRSADEALYRAKRAGRNRVEIQSEPDRA